MSDNFWRKFNEITGLLAMGVLFGLLAFAATIEVKDLDIWLHLKMGKLILEQGYVPDRDIFSCVIAGRPWVNHEWLFQVLVYLVYSAGGGFNALIAMQVSVVLLTVLILLSLGYTKERQLISILPLLLVLMVYITRFTIRPDLFSLLFFAMYMLILSLHLDKRWSILALFVIQVLWTNMHGFFFLGPLLITIAIASEAIKRRIPLPYEWNKIGRLTDAEFKRLTVAWVFVILACLINPQTFKGAFYPIYVGWEMRYSKIFFQHIYELQRPITLNNIFENNEFRYYKLLVLLSAFSFGFNRKKIDVGVLIFWLMFLFFSLAALRNMIFFAFAAYLVFVVNCMTIDSEEVFPVQFSTIKFKYITGALLKIGLAIWMLNTGMDLSRHGYMDFDTFQRKPEFGGGLSQNNFPTKAVDFLVQQKIKGNFFNDFNSGAYLIGRCYPNIRVFMDGRTEEYGPEYFETYQKIWKKGEKKVFDGFERQHNITGAFLNAVMQHVSDEVLNLFYKEKKWALVYFNYDGAIFLKRIPAYAPLIKKYEIDLKKWTPPPFDLQKLGPRPINPQRFIVRASMLTSLGFYPQALQEVRMALKISPDYAEAYRILGDVYDNQKNYQEAFENYRIALSMEPGDTKTRYNVAMAYENLGNYPAAIAQHMRLLELFPNEAKAHFALAKAYAKNRQSAEALRYARQGHDLDPKNVPELFKVADILTDKGQWKAAQAVYEIALATKLDDVNTYERMGRVAERAGQIPKARDYYQKALQKDPGNAKAKADLNRLNAKGTKDRAGKTP